MGAISNPSWEPGDGLPDLGPVLVGLPKQVRLDHDQSTGQQQGVDQHRAGKLTQSGLVVASMDHGGTYIRCIEEASDVVRPEDTQKMLHPFKLGAHEVATAGRSTIIVLAASGEIKLGAAIARLPQVSAVQSAGTSATSCWTCSRYPGWTVQESVRSKPVTNPGRAPWPQRGLAVRMFSINGSENAARNTLSPS